MRQWKVHALCSCFFLDPCLMVRLLAACVFALAVWEIRFQPRWMKVSPAGPLMAKAPEGANKRTGPSGPRQKKNKDDVIEVLRVSPCIMSNFAAHSHFLVPRTARR